MDTLFATQIVRMLRFSYVSNKMKPKRDREPVVPKEMESVAPEPQETIMTQPSTTELTPVVLDTLEQISDDELELLQRRATEALENRRRKQKQIHIDRIKADMAQHGLTYRDFMSPTVRTGASRSGNSANREVKFGIEKMLPAMAAILKDGPKSAEVLRTRLKEDYNYPLNVIGMILRWGYLEKLDTGDYMITEKGRVEAAKWPAAPPPLTQQVQSANLNGQGPVGTN